MQVAITRNFGSLAVTKFQLFSNLKFPKLVVLIKVLILLLLWSFEKMNPVLTVIEKTRSLSNPNVWPYGTGLWKLQNRSNFTSGTPGHHKILKWKPGSNHGCQKHLPKTQQSVEFQTIVCSIFHSDESSGLFLILHEFGSHQSTFETQTLFLSFYFQCDELSKGQKISDAIFLDFNSSQKTNKNFSLFLDQKYNKGSYSKKCLLIYLYWFYG